jgi:hypothetical protein
MSQTIFPDINPAATSGTQLATHLNDFKAALMSGQSGTARPSETLAGGYWVDTTNDPTYWSYKMYTGTSDVEIFRLNLTTASASITGADSTFDILRVAADAVGPILKLIKRRIASNGQVLAGDIVGHIQAIGRASDSSNPVVANVKVVAIENQTASASGVYLAWETTPAASVTAVEHMRLMNGFLGIGTVAPDAMVHAKGATGIKSEYIADVATPAKLTMQKSRLAGTGATQNADEIAEVVVITTDDTTAKVQSAGIKAVATEAHTTSARGTKLAFYTSPTGGTTPTNKMDIGDKVNPVAILKVPLLELDSQSVATTATIVQLSATKAVVEFTGSTATDIQGINSTALTMSKVIVLHNISTATVTLKHENGSAAAADRIKLPGAADVLIPAQKTVELWYSPTDTRWKLKSGIDAGGPMTATGDIMYGGTGGTATRLAAGSNGLYLGLSGGIPSWSSPAGSVAITAATTTYSILTTDDVITCSGASFTLTLPTAVGVAGKQYTIKHLGTSLTQVYTLNTTSAQTIGGVASGAYALYTNQELIKIISDGANWQILDRFARVPLTSFTPTFNNFGTVSTFNFLYQRDGNELTVLGNFTVGTPAGAAASITLPSGLNSINTASLGSTRIPIGTYTTTNTNNSSGHMMYVNNASQIDFGANFGAATPGGGTVNANVMGGAGNAVILQFKAPLSTWRP